jgi:hypothetical protein
LQSLKRFTCIDGAHRRARSGRWPEALQHTATADMDVERPNKIRVVMEARVAARALLRRQDGDALHAGAEVLLDGRVLRHDRQADRPLERAYSVQLPLQDLFLWGTPARRSTRSNRR